MSTLISRLKVRAVMNLFWLSIVWFLFIMIFISAFILDIDIISLKDAIYLGKLSLVCYLFSLLGAFI